MLFNATLPTKAAAKISARNRNILTKPFQDMAKIFMLEIARHYDPVNACSGDSGMKQMCTSAYT